MDLWLDALKDGGRLILPLCVLYKLPDGTPMTRGGIFLIERDAAGFAASYKSATAIYPCFGASDPDSEASLTEAFRRGGAEKVRRLYRSEDPPADACWAKGTGWALAYERSLLPRRRGVRRVAQPRSSTAKRGARDTYSGSRRPLLPADAGLGVVWAGVVRVQPEA